MTAGGHAAFTGEETLGYARGYPESSASWKRVNFRLVAFSCCVLKLSHCLLASLDGLID